MAVSATILEISKTVKYLRKKSKQSQKELADYSGVGKTVIFDIEKGKESVRLCTLLKVFFALNIKVQLQTPIPITTTKTKTKVGA